MGRLTLIVDSAPSHAVSFAMFNPGQTKIPATIERLHESLRVIVKKKFDKTIGPRNLPSCRRNRQTLVFVSQMMSLEDWSFVKS